MYYAISYECITPLLTYINYVISCVFVTSLAKTGGTWAIKLRKYSSKFQQSCVDEQNDVKICLQKLVRNLTQVNCPNGAICIIF